MLESSVDALAVHKYQPACVQGVGWYLNFSEKITIFIFWPKLGHHTMSFSMFRYCLEHRYCDMQVASMLANNMKVI